MNYFELYYFLLYISTKVPHRLHYQGEEDFISIYTRLILAHWSYSSLWVRFSQPSNTKRYVFRTQSGFYKPNNIVIALCLSILLLVSKKENASLVLICYRSVPLQGLCYRSVPLEEVLKSATRLTNLQRASADSFSWQHKLWIWIWM